MLIVSYLGTRRPFKNANEQQREKARKLFCLFVNMDLVVGH